MSDDTKNRSAATLITGASAGIGRELARVFASHDHDLILVARRKSKLRALATSLHKKYDVEVTVLPVDLTEPEAPQSLFDDIAKLGIRVDIVINNAGVLRAGPFGRMSREDIDGMIQLNIHVLTIMCRLFLRPMLERGEGRIVNLASLAAFQPMPSLAVYAATKAYVLAMTEALAEEVRTKGVRVCAVCPGFTDTDMMKPPGQGAGNKTVMPAMLIMTPERVAEQAYAACMRGDVIKVTGLGNAVASVGVRFIPRWIVRSVSGFVARGGRLS